MTEPEKEDTILDPDDRMRVAYILTPIEFGGSEKVNLLFLRQVDRRKFDILPILLIRPWEGKTLFEKELEKEGFAFTRIPVAVREKSAGRDYFRVGRCCWMIRRIIRDQGVHLVHTHGYFADIVGVAAARTNNIRAISTCHGFIRNNRKLGFYNTLDRFFLRWADRVIAVSEGIQSDLLKSGIREEKVRVLQNAVSEGSPAWDMRKMRDRIRAELHLDDRDYVVGFIGRLSPEKGISILIEAVRLLKEEGIPVTTLIVGDGPEKDSLAYAARSMGLEGTVLFPGFQRDINAWLAAMDVFVLPSFSEGSPMAVLEAMSAGIPIIASRVGGLPAIIEDGVNGCLIPPGDPVLLAGEIRRLLFDPTKREAFGRNATSRIREKYNLVDWCKKIEGMYEDLVGNASLDSKLR